MRIRADEHVAPAIVHAINQIALGDGFELTSVLKEGFKGASDVHWITAFAADGGEAILTADTDFQKQPPQGLAVEQAGLRVIHLPATWANATLSMQAGHLLIWWNRIERQLSQMSPRECFTMAMSITEDAALKRVAVDFHKARQKFKKATRPGRAN